MSWIKPCLLFSIALSLKVFAHDGDHSAPGALPFAPHGGKAVEAEVEGADKHDHEGEGHDKHDHGKEKAHAEHDDHGHDDHDHEKEEKHAGQADDHGHDHDHEKEGKDEHDHGKAGAGAKEPSLEYFFEATYENGKLVVYPLALDEENPKEFILVRVGDVIKNLRVSVDFPRSKRTEAVSMSFVQDENKGDRWEGKVPSNKDIRFFTNIEANWGGVNRKARIHLEKRK